MYVECLFLTLNRKEELEKIAKTGKQPYYYSELELKKIRKERKYEELVRTGKLDRYRFVSSFQISTYLHVCI